MFLALTSLALAILYFSPQNSITTIFSAGLDPSLQLAIGLGLGLAFATSSYFGFVSQSKKQHTKRTIASYSRLDLSGLNPVWFGLTAGFGEELLFRGALQPLLGIWITSVVFVVAHVHAYQFKNVDKTALVQMATLFGTSAALGLIAQYVGLVAAILVHTLIDISSLYLLRGIKQRALLDAG